MEFRGAKLSEDRFYRVISSKVYSRAYRLYKNGGGVFAEQIRQQERWAPIEALPYRGDVKGLSAEM